MLENRFIVTERTVMEPELNIDAQEEEIVESQYDFANDEFVMFLIAYVLQHANIGTVEDMDYIAESDLYQCKMRRGNDAFAKFIGDEDCVAPVIAFYWPDNSDSLFKAFELNVHPDKKRGKNIEAITELTDSRTLHLIQSFYKQWMNVK